jgi:hypothetical protein
LERRIGGPFAYRLTGSIGSNEQTILSNPEWTVRASRSGDLVVFRWDYGNGNVEESAPVKMTDNGPSTIDVVFDPLPLGVGRVVVNETSVIGAPVKNSPDSVVDPNWTQTNVSASFCQKLQARQ